MAALWRLSLRRFSAPWRRTISTFHQELLAEEEHAVKTTLTWRNISLFFAIPAVLLTAYSSYRKEVAHLQHIEEHGRPEFVPYAHLRIRAKPFPWGDGNHSLIHNPHVNPLPEGYEEEH